jgi:hypothetical protein
MGPPHDAPSSASHPEPSAGPDLTPIRPGHDPAPVPAVRPSRIWALATAAGLLAGVVSWGAGEACLTVFKPDLELVFSMGGPAYQPTRKSEIRAETRNATLAYGLLGATLGASLGLAGGLARGQARCGAIAGIVGLVAGGAVVVGVSLVLVPLFYRALLTDPLSPDLTTPLLIHAGAWATAGAAGGMAFGLGLRANRRRLARATFGGLIGAALGAAVFELLGAVAFPLANTPRPLALTWTARLVARLLVATLAAIGAAAMIAREPAGRSDVIQPTD